MESNKLLNVAQSGFRANHSTQDVLLKCTDDWKTALDDGKIVGTVMIDLSKAFDSIDHPLLMQKLEALGIREKENLVPELPARKETESHCEQCLL